VAKESAPPSSVDGERPIRAAGGVLQRPSVTGPEILLVHRPRYDDWSLPKGKLKTCESWESAALREVFEETGHRPIITSFAGPVIYRVNGRPKIVLFWSMQVEGDAVFHPSREVDAVDWLDPAAAYARLKYPSERQLLADLFPREIGASPT
jgi:8-oxo-dGTP pyrophosphatase MutT (NUDIX family)